jgi:hypothetical protein
MRIENGAFLYFMPRETTYVAGRAIVFGRETKKIDAAWENWREGNGAASLDQFRRMVLDNGIPNEDGDIGCLLLIRPQFIDARPIIPDSLNPTAQQSIHYFTDAMWPEIKGHF